MKHIVAWLNRVEARLRDFVDPRRPLLRELREEKAFRITLDSNLDGIQDIMNRLMADMLVFRVPKDLLIENRHDRGYLK